MKVGEYIRTNEGIRKIEKIYKYDVLTDISFNEYSSNLNDRKDLENQIIKSSQDIIDLIEVGDYVVHNAGSFYYHILDIYTVEETD
jgi:hypothetical protein